MNGKNFVKKQLKEPALTAISYLIPIVVAGGFLLAIGSIMGGTSIANTKHVIGIWDAFSTMGGQILGLLPMVVGTGVAFAIADKPGIAPGMLVGLISIVVNAGFLGGLVGGYIAGWVTLAIIKYVKLPKIMDGMMPTLIIPLFASGIAGLIMFYIIGTPISALMTWLTHFMKGLNSHQLFFYGAIIGLLASVDYGGAINKTVFAFVLALQSQGINEPITCLILASMVTPFGYTLAFFLGKIFRKRIYTDMEVETLKTAFPMGIFEITEGSLPIVLNDLWRSVVATGAGGAVGGGFSMLWGADSHIPATGMLAIPTMTKPMAFIGALLIGTAVTGIVYFLLKKPVTAETVQKEEEDIDLGDLKID